MTPERLTAAQQRIGELEREIAEAREACPSGRMQDYFNAPLLTLVNNEVLRGFNRDAELSRIAAKLQQAEAERDRLQQERDAILEDMKSHWFIQGGTAQFGGVEVENARNPDAFIAAVLSHVRGQLRALESRADAAESRLAAVAELVEEWSARMARRARGYVNAAPLDKALHQSGTDMLEGCIRQLAAILHGASGPTEGAGHE